MESLSSRLKNKAQIWGRVTTTNSLGETDAEERLIGALWCDIVPKTGKVETIPNAAAEYATITHEVTFRRSALTRLKKEYHLVYRGQRLDIEYIMPHYNKPDMVIAYCREDVGL